MTTVPLGPGSGMYTELGGPVKCAAMTVAESQRALVLGFQRADGAHAGSVRLYGRDAEGLFAAALEEGWEVFRRAVDALEVCNVIAQQGWRGDAELPDGRTLAQVVAEITGGVVNG